MPESEEEKVRRIASEIRRYLNQNPQAADMVEGIATWWLLPQQLEDSIPVIERALALLVDEGVIEIIHLKDGKAIYRLKTT